MGCRPASQSHTSSLSREAANTTPIILLRKPNPIQIRAVFDSKTNTTFLIVRHCGEEVVNLRIFQTYNSSMASIVNSPVALVPKPINSNKKPTFVQVKAHEGKWVINNTDWQLFKLATNTNIKIQRWFQTQRVSTVSEYDFKKILWIFPLGFIVSFNAIECRRMETGVLSWSVDQCSRSVSSLKWKLLPSECVSSLGPISSHKTHPSTRALYDSISNLSVVDGPASKKYSS